MRLRILVLSRDVSAYKAAFYQADFLRELANQHDCVFYGPGFPSFDRLDSLERVLQKTMDPLHPFLMIVVAHSWLSDEPDGPISPMLVCDLAQASVPTALLLNKEYTRLSEKLDWAESAGIDVVFSHHHEIGQLAEGRNLATFFLPFAFSTERFGHGKSGVRSDFGFTGILKNPNNSKSQGNVRAEVQSEIFHSFFGVPILKRKRYLGVRVRWRSWTGNRVRDAFAALMMRPRASEKKYVSLISETAIWLNGPSPLGLISTRYFECMAVGSVVLTSSTPGVKKVLPEGTYVEFDGALDFREKLFWLLDNPEIADTIRDRAKSFVYRGHTWQHRVQELTKRMVRLRPEGNARRAEELAP